jgi:hypothetical protein
VKGSSITYNARFFLRRGDEVTIDAKSIALYGTRLTTRSPHLAYGKNGLADLIPADAMLRIQLWVQDVH